LYHKTNTIANRELHGEGLSPEESGHAPSSPKPHTQTCFAEALETSN